MEGGMGPRKRSAREHLDRNLDMINFINDYRVNEAAMKRMGMDDNLDPKDKEFKQNYREYADEGSIGKRMYYTNYLRRDALQQTRQENFELGGKCLKLLTSKGPV